MLSKVSNSILKKFFRVAHPRRWKTHHYSQARSMKCRLKDVPSPENLTLETMPPPSILDPPVVQCDVGHPRTCNASTQYDLEDITALTYDFCTQYDLDDLLYL
jgi:hypothetical protein